MASAKPIIVWIVDDVESVRKSIAAVLETANMAVCDYASAAAFLAEFKPGAIGCLVVDHHMPDMTGLELLQHLQGQNGAPPTIVISGHANQALHDKAIAAGAVKMINKPVDADELIQEIERVMLNPA